MPAGRATTLAVREAIAAAKGGDALAPVRVVVTSNLAGLSLRRLLGSSELEEDTTAELRGIANVNFSTPFQFASLLAAPTLAADGLRPLTTSVLGAAVRHVLKTSPGRFGAVAKHVATESALIRMYGELTEMPPSHRQLLAQSADARTLDLLAFVDAVGEHLGSTEGARYHDEFTVLQAAARVAQGAGPGPAELNDRVVLVGPFTQGVATVEFLADLVSAASQRGPQSEARAVWAMVGDEEVDEAARSQAASIAGQPVQATPAAPVPVPTTLVSTADSDQEALEVVRSILSAAANGARFDRMAVFVPMANPYLRTVREHLDRAGIPSAGPEYRTLSDSMTGRLLSSLLELSDAVAALPADKQFSRETVLALVSAAPLRGPDGRPLRSGPWENLSRSAGVVGGLEGWSLSLAAHTESIEKRITDHPDAGEGFVGRLRRDLETVRALAGFVEWLGELITQSAQARTWKQRSEWVRETLAALLPQENRRSSWPESEVDAAERIYKVLSRVESLDLIEPDVSPATFVRALQLELDVPAGRRGRFGTGVLVAPLASAVGLDLDHVFVVGMTEGLCPRPIREDTLIPDEQREIAAGGLPTRHDRNRQERQRYLFALAAGNTSATLTLPLGDHRNGRQRTASRWWIEALRALENDPAINSRNWAESSVVSAGRGSFVQSLSRATQAGLVTSAAELHMQRVHAHRTFGTALDESLLPVGLRNGLTQIEQRLDGFNRFNGDLSGAALSSPASDGRAISPSRLEEWATCPRRYFLNQVLKLGEVDRPEEITEISALDRGSLVHSILEDFIAGAVSDRNDGQNPERHWNEADRDRLFTIAEKHFAEYEALNRTGKPILWAIRKEETLNDLEGFLRSDEKLRSELRTVPHDVEVPFGMGERFENSVDAVAVALSDGRKVALRGLIDRLDRRPIDGVPVVLDYKTGRAQSQKQFDEDPVLGGTKLQLGVYAYAAKQILDADMAHAYYWYVTSKGNFAKAGYPWGREQDERFREAVTTIIDGIESGQFPPQPGEYNFHWGDFQNCSFCQFKRLCPQDRNDEFAAAVESGRLVDYVKMLAGPPKDEAEGSNPT